MTQKEELVKDLTDLQRQHQKVLGAMDYVLGKLRALDMAEAKKLEKNTPPKSKQLTKPSSIDKAKAQLKAEIERLEKKEVKK